MTLREQIDRPNTPKAVNVIFSDFLARCMRAITGAVASENQRLFLWLPVLVAIGISIYFAFTNEPGMLVFVATAAIAITGIMLWHQPHLFWLGACLIAITAGFAAAKLRSGFVDSPQIERRLNSVQVTGWLERIETSGAGRRRLVIQPVNIQRVDRDKLPNRVRLTIRRLPDNVRAGEGISVRATLLPLPPPISPDGFDFARALYFQGLGAVGFPMGKFRPALSNVDPPFMVQFRGWVSRARLTIAHRITSTLEGPKGALVSALLVGDRSKLTKADQASLRDAGLAHLLAISGLHMALMVGTLFWLARAVFALSVKLTLEYPIKKWAAAIALIGGLAYLLLSGGAVSTIRAYIMLGVMFLAIMVDRPAITMRNVAIAALLILLAMPESLLSPGFQMSFATVTALVAANEFRLKRKKAHEIKQHMVKSERRHWARKIALYFLGIALTTCIATLATAPIAAYHFQRLAIYGVAANMLAIPIMATWLMPAGLIALLVMPFGMEHWPLLLAGVASDAVLQIGRDISNWLGAVTITQAISLTSLSLFMLGGLWLCLWQGRWRLIAIAPLVLAGAASALPNARPDVLIARAGDNIAVRGQDDALALAFPRAARFAAQRWLLTEGDQASAKQAANRRVLNCDQTACHAIIKGLRLAYVLKPAGLDDACTGPLKADIVIAKIPLFGACPNVRVTIDRFDLWLKGAHAIRIMGDDIIVETANDTRGNRPWVVVRRRRK